MKRREFTAGLGACLGALLAAPSVRAQVPQPGREYMVLNPPLRTLGAGRIDVVEFFWYGCPHCNRFEPLVDRWKRQLPDDVSFRRVPVALRDAYVVHQRLYYALEALGRVDDLHRKVFDAIHRDRRPLNTEAEQAAFAAEHGIEREQYVEAYRSDDVETRARHARELWFRYRIDGVPAIGVAGRYWTSGGLTNSPERTLEVADHLIGLARQQQ